MIEGLAEQYGPATPSAEQFEKKKKKRREYFRKYFFRMANLWSSISLLQNTMSKIFKRISQTIVCILYLVKKAVGYFIKTQIFADAWCTTFLMLDWVQRTFQICTSTKLA